MEDVEDQFTLYKGPFQSYSLGEACLHDDVDVKEALNIVLQKIVGTSTAYVLALKNFANFIIEVLFSTPLNERPRLAPM